MRIFAILLALTANLALADAIVKEWAVQRLKGADAIEVVQGFFSLAYVENRGCAWGMFQGSVWPLAVFGAVALALLVWKRRSVFGDGKPAVLFSGLLYAGILGNMLDRIVRGFVVDMFDFHWGAHHFPCFNLADAYITLAAAYLVCMSVFAPDKGKKR